MVVRGAESTACLSVPNQRTSDRANGCSRAVPRRCPMPNSSRCCCAPESPAAARSTSRATSSPASAASRAAGGARRRRRRRCAASVRAKCAELAAVVELARRSLTEEARACDALASPQAVRDYLRLLLAARPYEVFVGLFLDSQNRLLAADELFRGTLAQTSVYPREVVKAALACNAAAMIFAHNHPSGRRRAEPRRRAADPGAEAGAGARRHPHARPFRRRRRPAHVVRGAGVALKPGAPAGAARRGCTRLKPDPPGRSIAFVGPDSLSA